MSLAESRISLESESLAEPSPAPIPRSSAHDRAIINEPIELLSDQQLSFALGQLRAIGAPK